MDSKSAFNATVCIIGIALFLIHTINILLKKNKRKDELYLLAFVVFNAFHFAAYLVFTIIKTNYTSDNLIIAFYTVFYIMNNFELLLLMGYAMAYIPIKQKTSNILLAVCLSLYIVFVALDIANIFNHMFFYAENGVYTRAKTMIVSQGYQFVTFAMVFCLAIFNKKVKIAEKIAFSAYCAVPLVAIIIQNLLPGYAVAYLSIIIALEILFLFVNVRKNMELAHQAKKNKEAEVKIMISQIQPHFIYNTLASISTLIKIDPDKAEKGLDDFTDYLRANLSSLSKNGLIPFADELKHVETYLSLEKMRFEDRLNVVYDIQTKDFMLPALSLQPLVENAAKHGILKKIEGGTITFKTYENSDAHVVEITDDGVGFDPNDVKGSNHYGLNNVRYRISSMCRGEVKVESELNKGTTVTVFFYK